MPKKKSMTKEYMLKAIRQCAKKLGRTPTLRELRQMAGITKSMVWLRCGNLRKALACAGIQAIGPGFGESHATLLLDWARVTRKLKRTPSMDEYETYGRFSYTPFHSRYGRWQLVAQAFTTFARESRMEAEWKDVLEIIEARTQFKRDGGALAGNSKQLRRGPILEDRPIYGGPLPLPEMEHEPTNESGVLFLFALLARQLGFRVQQLQMGYPDCEALREVAKGRWQRVRIEIEFESRNFLQHRHKPNGCDLIVCWAHNWPQCPLEVIELSRVVKELYGGKGV